jgi:hypothetical protein
MEKVMVNIQKYGNTTAATLHFACGSYENQIKKGDNIILTAFGGGFTWGALYLKWAYYNPGEKYSKKENFTFARFLKKTHPLSPILTFNKSQQKNGNDRRHPQRPVH